MANIAAETAHGEGGLELRRGVKHFPPPEEAREMFVRLVPRAIGPDPAVAELVRLAGFLPLAISLLARVYARHPSWTLTDLAAETTASMLTLAAEKDSVAAAFEVSYRHLDLDHRRFFQRLGLHPGTAIDGYAAAALAGTGLREADRYLDVLHGVGLLTEAGYHRYNMHDLIRRYVRGRADADPVLDRQQALDRLLDYYQHTAALAEARLAHRARTSPAPALRAPPAALPALAGPIRRWRGHGLNGPTCSPALTMSPTLASMPGSWPSPPRWPPCCGRTVPGPTPWPVTPPPSRRHVKSVTGWVRPTPCSASGPCDS